MRCCPSTKAYINTELSPKNHSGPASSLQKSFSHPVQHPQSFLNMQFLHVKLAIVIATAVILACWFSEAEATYRKPPFNGSIFGKRGTATADADNAGKALSAMCEIANEACQSWFASQEK